MNTNDLSTHTTENTDAGAGLFDRRDLVICLMLAMAVFAVYAGVFSASFISFDDSGYVYDNPVIKHGFTLDGLKRIWDFRQELGPYWHPVTSLSHMADCTLFGLKPGAHHGVNVLIHALNVLLLFLFLTTTSKDRAKSFWVAALFALHPLNVETVAWISERKNLLATFFFLSGLFAFHRYHQKKDKASYVLVCVLFILGLMSKPSMMTFPFTLFLVILFPFGGYTMDTRNPMEFVKKNKDLIMPILPMIGGMIVLFFVGFFLSGEKGNVASFQYIPMKLRMANMLVADLVYLKKLFLPFGLSVFHPYPQEVETGWTITAVMVLGAISVYAVMTIRTFPVLFCGWFWYVGNLVTASGLMQKGFWPAYADRFTYLPMIGIFMILVWGLPKMLSSLRIPRLAGTTAGLLGLASLAVLTVMQTAHWKNAVSLFGYAVSVDNKDVLSMTNLALALGEEGRIDEAIDMSNKALSLEPRFAEALNNLGTLYGKKGEIEKSLGYFQKSLDAYPGFDKAKANLDEARKLMAMNNPSSDAEKQALSAYARNPKSIQAATNLFKIYLDAKKYQQAEEVFLSMYKTHPEASISIAYNLACLYTLWGRGDDAVKWLDKAIKSGFRAWTHLDNDPDLKPLKNRDDFNRLMNEWRKGEAR